jgi:hypothetical protein
MTPDNQLDQRGEQPSPRPATPGPAPFLGDDARATIYLDGLIYAAYNENRRVLESAILTTAEDHQLDIEVRLRGSNEQLFPTPTKPWDPKHTTIAEDGPSWLYVDSGNGIQENEFSATLHSGNDKQAFDTVFNFEAHHKRSLPLKTGRFAVFNFPHGLSYSAKTDDAELKLVPANESADEAVPKGTIPVSNLGGIDITAVSNGAGKKFIVLANQNGQHEFFRFELEPDKQYEIHILNQPSPGTDTTDHEKHFLQFYELFGFDPATEQRFLVVNPGHAHETHPRPSDGASPIPEPPTPDNPPCAPGRSGGSLGLDSGGGG